MDIDQLSIAVKSREIQRGMLAEAAGDCERAAPHFLAAAHLELVLANDYDEVGQEKLAFRSRLSAASCLWRAGQIDKGRDLLSTLLKQYPDRKRSIKQALAELERNFAKP